MSKNKMRSKEEILGNISSESDYIDIAEALLDIRDILNERMSKGVEVHRVAEEVIKDAAIKVGDGIVCEYCGELMPASDIYYVQKAGREKIKHVCKNCISFVEKLKKE